MTCGWIGILVVLALLGVTVSFVLQDAAPGGVALCLLLILLGTARASFPSGLPGPSLACQLSLCRWHQRSAKVARWLLWLGLFVMFLAPARIALVGGFTHDVTDVVLAGAAAVGAWLVGWSVTVGWSGLALLGLGDEKLLVHGLSKEYAAALRKSATRVLEQEKGSELESCPRDKSGESKAEPSNKPLRWTGHATEGTSDSTAPSA
jgi:hypothetical protein